MEILQAAAGFVAAILVVSAVMQVVFSYALQVMSEKNELPEFASFLSWIPVLNMYPLIRNGGGNFRNFILGAIGFVVLAGASAALSAGVGALVGIIVFGLLAIGMFVYMVRLVMATAANRGLSKWLGLLIFVPLANVFLYPYIAFHDGFRAPNKIGLAIGLLIAFAPIPSQLATFDTIVASATAMAAAQESGDLTALVEVSNAAGLGEAAPGLAPALEIASQLAMLDGLNADDPSEAEAMRTQLALLRTQLESGALGPDAMGQFEPILQELEARLSGGEVVGDIVGSGVGETAGQTAGETAADATASTQIAVVPPTAPSSLDHTPPVTSAIVRAGDLGFEVPATVPCPADGVTEGAAPPEGKKQWCARTEGDLKHGWFTAWHENGQPAIAGEYRDGLKVGVWTRWHANGEKRVQAEFENGLQQGAMIAWSDSGVKVHEEHFSGGGPASR